VSVRQQFEENFSEEKLKSIYQQYIVLSAATGIDNLSHKAFWPMLDGQISIISRKVFADTAFSISNRYF
jgi:RNA-directed DNA polymerase